jgi:hypothetical protein
MTDEEELERLINAAHPCVAIATAEEQYAQSIIAALFDAFAAKSDLKTEHIEDALKKSPPLSVTMAERVEQLRQWAQGRCVPAD